MAQAQPGGFADDLVSGQHDIPAAGLAVLRRCGAAPRLPSASPPGAA